MYVYIKKLKNDEELVKKIDMPTFFKKIIIKIKKVFNIITVKKIDNNKYLYIIPKIEKLEKVKKIIENNKNKKIILSKKLKKYRKELNLKPQSEITKYFVKDILEYFMDVLNRKLELENVYILLNQSNNENIEMIQYLQNRVKTINIVTDNIKQYYYLKNKLDSEEMPITISSNKNKSLKKAKFIINLDFNNDSISKYKINANSIIINSSNEIIKMQKYFQGIIVNSIEISEEKKEEKGNMYDEFDTIDMYENILEKEPKYADKVRKIKENKVKIINLIGNNGIINLKEILNMQKNIDKLQKLE